MPRQEGPDEREILERPHVPAPRHAHGTHQELLDPRQPIADGQMANVTPGRETADKGSRERFTMYARNLIGTHGDIVKAVCLTLGKDPENDDDVADVTANLAKYHEQIRAASRNNRNIGELFETHDVTLEVRVVMLRELMFHPDPAVRLRAIDFLNEMDETSKAARIGSSWEETVRLAKARAARKRAALNAGTS
jgi:hypothetical protein